MGKARGIGAPLPCCELFCGGVGFMFVMDPVKEGMGGMITWPLSDETKRKRVR